MKITYKLYLFSTIIVCIFTIILSLSTYNQRSMIKEIEQILERDVEIYNALTNLAIKQLEQSIQLERIVRHMEEQHFNKMGPAMFPANLDPKINDILHFDDLFRLVEKSLPINKVRGISHQSKEEYLLIYREIQKINNLHNQYLNVYEDIVNVLQSGTITDLAVYTMTFETLEDELHDTITDTLEKIQVFTADSIRDIKIHESKGIKIYTSVGFLILIVVCTFLYLLIRTIRQSIGHAVDIAVNIENGKRELPEKVRTKDEIGQIIHAMGTMLRSINQTEAELKRLALTDALTGVANRLNFNTNITNETERAQRYNRPLSLIIFDIDHFKSINDTYGHDTGDLVLIEIAELASENTRSSDLFARWGGEEFVLLLTDTGLNDAAAVAEKLRLKIEKHHFPDKIRVTSSFGVCQYAGEDLEGFLKRADNALYASKNAGRNRVTIEKKSLT